MKTMEYRVAWKLSDKCNFQCRYCYITPSVAEKTVHGSQIKKALKNTGKNWIIGITGGEPFIYPDFVGSCKALTQEYRISLDTNLSPRSVVEQFVHEIDPERVEYIYASTHIEERERKGAVSEFIENIHLLRKYKFDPIVNYVMHPTLIDRFREDYKFFASNDIKLEPKPFKGKYNGKIYPGAYTKYEEGLILKYNPNAIKLVPFKSKGLRCNAGRSFIRIQPDGSITRCDSETTVIGDVFSDIKLAGDPKPCALDVCGCNRHYLIEDPKGQSCENDSI
jgi:MoaA/NifB/PqqE/SkfB family radical SAM enzyme